MPAANSYNDFLNTRKLTEKKTNVCQIPSRIWMLIKVRLSIRKCWSSNHMPKAQQNVQEEQNMPKTIWSQEEDCGWNSGSHLSQNLLLAAWDSQVWECAGRLKEIQFACARLLLGSLVKMKLIYSDGRKVWFCFFFFCSLFYCLQELGIHTPITNSESCTYYW